MNHQAFDKLLEKHNLGMNSHAMVHLLEFKHNETILLNRYYCKTGIFHALEVVVCDSIHDAARRIKQKEDSEHKLWMERHKIEYVPSKILIVHHYLDQFNDLEPLWERKSSWTYDGLMSDAEQIIHTIGNKGKDVRYLKYEYLLMDYNDETVTLLAVS